MLVALSGEKFETLLGDESVAHFYGISKTADVPSSYYPIRFVNNANVTASPTVVQGDGGKSYLYQVNRVLRPPNGERKDYGWALLPRSKAREKYWLFLVAVVGGLDEQASILFDRDPGKAR